MADIDKRIKKANRKVQMLLLERRVEKYNEALAQVEQYRQECAEMDRQQQAACRQGLVLVDALRQIKELTLIDSRGPWVPAELASKLFAIQRIVLPYLGESAVG